MRRLARVRWSPQFIAFYLWRCYWFDRFLDGHRRHPKTDRSRDPRSAEISRVYWRFRQHARLLGPSRDFTSGDEWAQLHFFAAVASATFRAAIDLVGKVDLESYPLRVHAPSKLEQAPLPFMLLTQLTTSPAKFELRIWPTPSTP